MQKQELFISFVDERRLIYLKTCTDTSLSFLLSKLRMDFVAYQEVRWDSSNKI